jgi:hypothetical protein
MESRNYNFEDGSYDPWIAYGQSKTAAIYMTSEIERRYSGKGLHGNALHPGKIYTGRSKHMDPEVLAQFKQRPDTKSPGQGAATIVIAAVGKEWENQGGKYLVDCSKAPKGENEGDIVSIGYAAHTYNPEKEARLWKDSLKAVRMEDDL